MPALPVLPGPPRLYVLPLTIERSGVTLLWHVERRHVATDKGDLLQGTLDMLVLKALQLESMHGWGITERIEQWSESVLQLGQGTLYPALYRLERQGLIRSDRKVTENNRRARYYSLTRKRRQQFSDELAQWDRMSRAVNLVLAAGLK